MNSPGVTGQALLPLPALCSLCLQFVIVWEAGRLFFLSLSYLFLKIKVIEVTLVNDVICFKCTVL